MPTLVRWASFLVYYALIHSLKSVLHPTSTVGFFFGIMGF
nr:MAG TPA: hypothetical protein [Caudoviricetes sp.]